MRYWKINYKIYNGYYKEVITHSDEMPSKEDVLRISKNNNFSFTECDIVDIILNIEQLEQEYHIKESQDRITNFLKQLKESDETIIHIFNNGSCYKLCKILKTLYPSANALYSREEGHWITEIDGGYYDIGGKINVQYVIDKVYESLPELESSADIPTFTNNIGVVYGKYI